MDLPKTTTKLVSMGSRSPLPIKIKYKGEKKNGKYKEF